MPTSSLYIACWTARDMVRRHRSAIAAALAVSVAAGAVVLANTMLSESGTLTAATSWATPNLPIPNGTSIVEIRAEALASAATTLRTVTWVLAVLVLLALLGTGFVRARRQATDIAIRRTVGASRRTLRKAAAVEAAGMTSTAVIGIAVLGSLLLATALGAWPGEAASLQPNGSTILLVLIPILPLAMASWLGVIPARGRTPTTPVAPPLELHMSGVMLGIATAVILSAVALAATTVPPSVADMPRTDVVRLTLPSESADPGSFGQTLDALTARYGTAPIGSSGIELGVGPVLPMTTECGNCSLGGLPAKWLLTRATAFSVGPDTFSTLGATITAGRDIQRSDVRGTEPVVVVNRALARDYFEGGDAVGRQLQVNADDHQWYRVIGIVDDPAPVGLGAGKAPPLRAYFSVLQRSNIHLTMLMAPGTQVLRSLLPEGTVIIESGSRRATIARDIAPLRWYGRMLLLTGIAALVVVLVAVSSMLGGWLRGERHEVGIRRSLGAPRWRILVWLVGRLLGVGLVAGYTTGFVTGSLKSALGIATLQLPSLGFSGAFATGVVLLLATAMATANSAIPLLRQPPAQLLET